MLVAQLVTHALGRHHPPAHADVHRFYYEKYDMPEKGIWRWNGGEGTKLLTECKRLVH